MSTVFDAAAISVAESPNSALGVAPSTIAITVPTTVTSVSIAAPNTTSSVDIQVPGPQGPPGLQNVYVSDTPPTGWGPEEEGFIWAQIL
jgi:hypothetical protein